MFFQNLQVDRRNIFVGLKKILIGENLIFKISDFLLSFFL